MRKTMEQKFNLFDKDKSGFLEQREIADVINSIFKDSGIHRQVTNQ